MGDLVGKCKYTNDWQVFQVVTSWKEQFLWPFHGWKSDLHLGNQRFTLKKLVFKHHWHSWNLRFCHWNLTISKGKACLPTIFQGLCSLLGGVNLCYISRIHTIFFVVRDRDFEWWWLWWLAFVVSPGAINNPLYQVNHQMLDDCSTGAKWTIEVTVIYQGQTQSDGWIIGLLLQLGDDFFPELKGVNFIPVT